MNQTSLNKILQEEINHIGNLHRIDSNVLESFAYFVIDNYRKKDPKPKVEKPKSVKPTASKPKTEKVKKVKPLTISQLKLAVYNRFGVQNTSELKKSASFKMATDGMDDLTFVGREPWERLYREFIGVLPEEENQHGYGCINGIDIFNYFKPWQAFGLDPQKSTSEDIKKAYHDLSKIYHPDVPVTGDSKIFDRINTMYRSISAEA